LEGYVARTEERRCAYRVLVGKPRRTPFRRSRHRWEDYIKWIFKTWDRGMDCSDIAQDRDWWWALVNGVMNILVPQNAGNFMTS
jgi:hypothetical protein